MDFMTYVITVVIAFFGLFVGGLLAHYTREELASLKQFILFFQMVSFVLLFVIFFAFFPFYVAGSLLLLSFAFIFFFWGKTDLNMLDYIVFAVLLVISSLHAKAHLLVTFFIFVFGIFSGSLFYILHTKHPHKKTKKKVAHHVAHHKHKGVHLSVDEILGGIFSKYYYFIILSVFSFVLGEILRMFLI